MLCEFDDTTTDEAVLAADVPNEVELCAGVVVEELEIPFEVPLGDAIVPRVDVKLCRLSDTLD